MNKIYRLVWNAVQRAWVVAGEFATAKGKGKTMPRRLSVKLAGVAGAGMVALLAVEPARAWMVDPGSIANGSAATDGGINTNTAIGDNAIASSSANDGAITAMGWLARASAAMSTAIGAESLAEAAGSTAIGGQARVYSADSTYSIAIGYSTGVSGNSRSATALGSQSTATGEGATVLGALSQAINENAVAVGHNVAATGINATALGAGSGAYADLSTALGANSSVIGTTSTYSTAIGSNATITDKSNVATVVGSYAIGTGMGATGLGAQSQALGKKAVAVGHAAVAVGEGAMALGGDSQALTEGALAAGYGAKAMLNNDIAIGAGSSARGGVSTLYGAIDLSAIAIGHNSQAGTREDDGSSGSGDIAIGESAKATKGSTAIGFGSTSSERSTAIGISSIALAQNSIAIGFRSSSLGEYAVAIGTGANARGEHSTGIGNGADAAGKYSVALGSSFAAGENSFGIGGNAYSNYDIAIGNAAYSGVTGANTTGSIAIGSFSTAKNAGIAMGYQSQATSAGAIALGADTKASARRSMALGIYSNASVDFGMALGANSTTSAIGGVALGYRSQATTDAGIAGYQSAGASAAQAAAITATTSTLGAVSVGDASSNLFRQINGVAAGTMDSDAVNVAQLRALAETPLTFTGNTGTVAKKLGETLTVQGTGTTAGTYSGNNLKTTVDGAGVMQLQMADNPEFTTAKIGNNTLLNSTGLIVTGGPSVTTTGINAGSKKITNVAAGDISATSTEAINGSQLNTIFTTGTKYFHANSTGTDSVASGADAVAIGMGAVASASKSVALGAGSLANGNTLSHQAYLVGGTAQAEVNVGDRRITGLSAGADDTDAVNVAQLREVSAGAVGDAVMYDSTAHNRVTLGGDTYNSDTQTGGAKITNVANGTAPSDAVNFSQLNTIYTTGTKYFHANSTGDDSQATGADSVAIGRLARAAGGEGVAMGAYSHATGDKSISLGVASKAGGVESIAFGHNTYANADGGVALGSYSFASTEAGISGYIPTGASAAQIAAINATTSTLGAVSVGNAAGNKFRQINGVAAGTADSDAVNVAQLKTTTADTVLYDSSAHNRVTLGGTGATAPVALTNVAAGSTPNDAVNFSQLNSIDTTGTKYFHANSTGTDSFASGADAVAIGMGAIASADNSVALGAGSLADGSTLSHQAYLVGGTARAEVNVGDRRITGLSAGADDADAVNLAQLRQVTAGSVADAVVYDSTAHNRVTLGGTGATAPVALTNVANGVAASDAVNVSQLTELTNTGTKYFHANSTGTDSSATGQDAVAIGMGAVADVARSVALGDGAKTQAAVGTRSVTLNGTEYLFAGQAPVGTVSVGDVGAERTLTHVAAGRLSDSSTDAINGSQLFATNQAIDGLQTGSVLYDTNPDGSPDYSSVTLGGDSYNATTQTGGTTITNVANGVAASDAVNVSQLTETNNNITELGDDITTIYGRGIKYFHANSTGALASATGQDAVAIGMGAVADVARSVALGDGAKTQAAVGTRSVTLNGTEYLFAGQAPVGTVSVGDVGAERTLTHVAAGRLSDSSTDAINGSQLFATNQAIDGLQTGSVLYDTLPDGSPDYSSVTLGGDSYNATTQTGGTTLTNVANGVAASDAVNVSQLTALTNTGTKYFHANSTGTDSSATGQDAVAIGMGAIASADNSVALGAGSQTAAAVGTAGATIGGNDYLFAGTAPTSTVSVGDVGAERTLTHVAAGRLSDSSTDAVNGSQLFATNSQVDINTTDISNLGDNITNLGDDITTIYGRGIKYFHANSTGAL
ncbi:trimeric autotransporter adhesin, partial [Buttiauxella sp. BIGb0552]|uniref:ESPR-type extended signal peptide-containing protein n=1 Tax=Buttiauxella sp. BIGb0552 TaxID=2485120 RepID=UPI0010CEEDA5